MVTSRSMPQQTAQIFSPFAGQNRAALRFSQIGQDTESPGFPYCRSENTPQGRKSQKRRVTGGERQDSSGGRILLGDSLSRLAAFALLDGLAEEVFDLTVDATQFVLRPGFELGPERRIDAQKKGLSFHHPCQSVVQRTGVDYGMHFGF